MASLEVAGLVEESDEGAGDGGREAAVLGKGFGGDEDEAGVCLPGGAVLGIEGHEDPWRAVARRWRRRASRPVAAGSSRSEDAWRRERHLLAE
jgi:hypothetical protein